MTIVTVAVAVIHVHFQASLVFELPATDCALVLRVVVLNFLLYLVNLFHMVPQIFLVVGHMIAEVTFECLFSCHMLDSLVPFQIQPMHRKKAISQVVDY